MPVLDCSKIQTGVFMGSCGQLATAGTAARVWLINYWDIDRDLTTFTENTVCTPGKVMTSLVLKSGAKAYPVDSMPNATVGSDSISAGTYRNTHLHSVTVRIFVHSEAAKCFINGATNSRVIAIVENADYVNSGETKFEVYGYEAGLSLTELTFTTELTDGAVYVATFASANTSSETTLPISFYADSVTETEALISSLEATA